MSQILGGVNPSITLGATTESWCVVTQQDDGKYDPETSGASIPQYVVTQGGVDTDVVDALGPGQRVKVRAGAAIAIGKPIACSTGGKVIVGNSGTTYDGKWLFGYALTAAAGDDEFIDAFFWPMFVADASAVA